MATRNAHFFLDIVLFHGASGGLILALHPRYLLHVVGDNYIIVGLLHSLICISQKFTVDLLALLGKGKKHELTFCLWCCFFYYFILVFYNSAAIILLIRVLYALTVQIVITIKELIHRTQPEENYIKMCNLVDVSRAAGISLGSIMGGYLFESYQDFTGNVLIASCLILVCILLLQNIDVDDSDLPHEESQLEYIIPHAIQRLKKLQTVDFKDKWNSFLFKTIHTVLFAIYFSRVGQYLFFNQEITSICLGYTIAYENLVALVCKCIVPFVREKITKHRELLDDCMLTSGFLLAALYYAPTYTCCLALFGIVSLLYAVVTALLVDDVLDLKSEPDVYEASETTANIINMVAPIIAGITCYVFDGFLLEVITITPVMVCVAMISKLYLARNQEQFGE